MTATTDIYYLRQAVVKCMCSINAYIAPVRLGLGGENNQSIFLHLLTGDLVHYSTRSSVKEDEKMPVCIRVFLKDGCATNTS